MGKGSCITNIKIKTVTDRDFNSGENNFMMFHSTYPFLHKTLPATLNGRI